MIQITLQFNTIDEAIVFLSKQHPVAKVRNAAAIEPIVGASTEIPAGAKAPAGDAKTNTGVDGQQTSQTAPTTNKRKPRADAGKPRGPRGATNAGGEGAAVGAGLQPVAGGQSASPTEATASSSPAPETAAPTAPAEADNAQPSGSLPAGAAVPQTAAPVTQEEATDKGSTSAPDAAVPTEASEKDAQDAIQKVFTQQGGPQLALDTLASFGVKRCRDLKPEQRGDFVAKCNIILAEKDKK